MPDRLPSESRNADHQRADCDTGGNRADEAGVSLLPGLAALFETINEIREDEDLNPDLEIRGVIVTLYQKIIRDQRNMLEMLKEKYNVLGIIKQSADTYRSIDDGTPVVLSNPKSEVAISYAEIARPL